MCCRRHCLTSGRLAICGSACVHASKPAVQTRRLPIKEHMTFSGAGTQRNPKWGVLNVNTVVEVLAEVCRTGSWAEALSRAAPERKRRLT